MIQACRPSDENLVVVIFKIQKLDSRCLFRLFELIYSLGKVIPIHLFVLVLFQCWVHLNGSHAISCQFLLLSTKIPNDT